MNNHFKIKCAHSTVCSPLILAGVLFHSSVAFADTSAACVANGGTNCPSGANTISNILPDVVSTITIPAGSCVAGSVTDVNVSLDIAHTWVGDLDVTLVGPGNVSQSILLDRPGRPPAGPGLGCSSNDVNAIFDDASAIPAENECAAAPPAIAGTVSPSTPLSAFNGGNGDGAWTLTIHDNFGGDNGELNDWSLDIACTAPMQVIPVFSLWGLLSLIGALGLGGRYAVRRRKKVTP